MVTIKDLLMVLNPYTAGEVFQTLKSEKKWLLALIIVFIPGLLSLAGNMLIQQKTMSLTMQLVEEQMETIPAEQRESIGDIQSIIMVVGIVMGIALIAVYWVVKAVVFHVSARIFGGTEVGISSTIHLLAYTYIPFIIQGLINVYKGIVYQVPTYEEFLQQVLPTDLWITIIRDYLNVFVLWSLILIVIAVREQYNLSNKRALLAVVIPYVGYIILMLGMGMISSQFMGGGIPVAGG
jgi:hypothetical protein